MAETLERLYAKLAGPAQRALQSLKLSGLKELAGYERETIAALHGIGPGALKTIEQELASRQLSFAGRRGTESQAGQDGVALVTAYIEQFPPAVRKKLEEMRRIIQTAAPEATEKISYQMPTYYLNGNLVHFAGYAKHIGFYPTPSGISAFEARLSCYKHAKGSVQFPLADPLPAELIRQIVLFRLAENTAQKG